VPKVVAAFGGGYVGAQQEQQGRALGAEAFKLAKLKAGDKAIMIGPFENENRGARERGTVAATTAQRTVEQLQQFEQLRGALMKPTVRAQSKTAPTTGYKPAQINEMNRLMQSLPE